MAKAEYCANGHERTPENTYIRTFKDGRKPFRVCRECSRAAGKRYRDKQPKAMLPVGHPIPDNEIHVTHTGVYFGRQKPFDIAYMYFNIDPVDLTFEPTNQHVFCHNWKLLPKHTYTRYGSYAGYVFQPMPLLRSGKIPFGIYELHDKDELIYRLTDKPLPKWCRDGVQSI